MAETTVSPTFLNNAPEIMQAVLTGRAVASAEWQETIVTASAETGLPANRQEIPAFWARLFSDLYNFNAGVPPNYIGLPAFTLGEMSEVRQVVRSMGNYRAIVMHAPGMRTSDLVFQIVSPLKRHSFMVQGVLLANYADNGGARTIPIGSPYVSERTRLMYYYGLGEYLPEGAFYLSPAACTITKIPKAHAVRIKKAGGQRVIAVIPPVGTTTMEWVKLVAEEEEEEEEEEEDDNLRNSDDDIEVLENEYVDIMSAISSIESPGATTYSDREEYVDAAADGMLEKITGLEVVNEERRVELFGDSNYHAPTIMTTFVEETFHPEYAGPAVETARALEETRSAVAIVTTGTISEFRFQYLVAKLRANVMENDIVFPQQSSIILNRISNWSPGQLQMLLANTGTSTFLVSFKALHVRRGLSEEEADDGSNPIKVLAVGVQAAMYMGRGDEITTVFDDAVLDGEDNASDPVDRFIQIGGTLTITKLPLGSQQANRSKRAVWRAKGFENCVFGAKVLALTRSIRRGGPFSPVEICSPSVFCPSSFSRCFTECAVRVVTEACDLRGVSSEEPSTMVSAKIDEYLNKKNNYSFTTKAFKSLNEYCLAGLGPDRVRVYFNLLHLFSCDYTFRPSHSRIVLAGSSDPGVHHGDLIICHWDGSFHRQVASGEEKQSAEGGTHYILLQDASDKFIWTRESILAMEARLRSHFAYGCNEIGIQQLHRLNAKRMEKKQILRESAERYMKKVNERKFIRGGVRVSPEEEEEIWMAEMMAKRYVAVYDFESIMVPQSQDVIAAHPNLAEFRELIAEGQAMQHVPVIMTCGIVKLPIQEDTGMRVDMSDEEAGEIVDNYVRSVELFQGERTCIGEGIRYIAAAAIELGMAKIYCYAHNATKYDAVLLLFHLMESDTDITVSDVLKTSRGFLSVTVTCMGVTIYLRCTKVYLANTLGGLCKAYELPKQYHKRDYDWESDFLTRDRLIAERGTQWEADLIEYSRMDVYSLALVVVRLEEMLQNILPLSKTRGEGGFHIQSVTLQGYIKKLLRHMYLEKPFPPNELLPYDERLMESLRGGMTYASTRVFESIYYKEFEAADSVEGRRAIVDCIFSADERDCAYIMGWDANSLYPYVMTKSVPKGAGSYAKYETVDEQRRFFDILDRIKDDCAYAWGIVWVKYEKYPPTMVPLRSERTKTGLKYTNAVEIGKVYCTTTEDLVTQSRISGIVIVPVESVLWCAMQGNQSEEYTGFVTDLYEKRQTAPNNMLNGGFKLILNSGFGSTGLRLALDMHIVTQPGEAPVHKYDHVADFKGSIALPRLEISQYKAKDGHFFGNISCKSTATNCILSKARRFMFDIFAKACEAQQITLEDGLAKHFHYMDTDSLFVSPIIGSGLEKAGYVGNVLGQVKNDYGENSAILYMFSPAPKVRIMKILKKMTDADYRKIAVGLVEDIPYARQRDKDILKSYMKQSWSSWTAEAQALDASSHLFGELEPAFKNLMHRMQLGDYKMETVGKFKGLPLGKDFDTSEKKDELFHNLRENWEVNAERERWTKNLSVGVVTDKIDYSISSDSLMRNRLGLHVRGTAASVQQKIIPACYPIGEFMQQDTFVEFPNAEELACIRKNRKNKDPEIVEKVDRCKQESETQIAKMLELVQCCHNARAF